MKKYIKWAIGGMGTLLVFLFQGVGTKYLPDNLPSFGTTTTLPQTVSEPKTSKFSRVEKTEVPSLRSPILDGNLFIEKHFNRLVFGGVNFDQVQLAARSKTGSKASILEREAGSISFQIYDMPYIEIAYKGQYLGLQIIPEYLGNDYIALYYTIEPIDAPTMKLMPATSI
ncbi:MULTISPECIES: hypothetical protein [Vibrio]|uniref:hypothetical protein n=1 Tax=Vibrio TaxID=662 RepID=UPI000577ECC8|nr:MULTISPECIES: hypothetical protein [Vibrio]EHU4917175.1 hypothetical protein [Vibrio vulnificus]EJL7832987.1 hypothetical protein [Vibrio vulnificus]MBM4973617.1 hypothetical protein [Vibrio parahaemolyticus]MCG6479711.1 hypothetical protein [Vibrio parahaemolyticus]MCU8168542.1 hypothetical protein [Vibrio vulnificus]